MSSFKEKISEIMQDFGGRIKNPLIATFLLVWTYHHWTLVFRLFSTYANFSVEEKLFLIKIYINAYGFCGMVLNPLIISFGSLFCYYIIAILAQLIKILGKFLNSLIAKIDKPSFVPLADLEKEQKYSKSLKLQLKQANDDNKDLIYFREGAEQKHEDLKTEAENAKKNILNNSDFKQNFERTMLILLSKITGSMSENIKDEFVVNNYNLMNGSWEIITSANIADKTGQTNSLIFDEKKVSNTNGKEVATIIHFKFFMSSRLLELTLVDILNSEKHYVYKLIQITKDEFVGFRDNQYCFFKRLK